uniref:Nucleolar protein 7 n=1 Tax=Naja naja TaxID=35670 RepID=A0A8C6XVS5_NAJNA
MEARSGGAEAGEPREAAVMAAAAFSDGEESDEAPEEVTFERAREAAAEERRLTGERARREKAILKEKRRHREELFKEQKKRKLLPENVLEELASTQTSINSTTDEQGWIPNCNSLSDQNVEDEVENQDDSEKDSEEEILATRCPPNYMAVRLKDQELSSQQQQEAKDFIQKHLYGASCNRTTANQYFSVENKKNAVKKAAIQFVNRSWGKVKKEKATRFTKHWVSSKIIP